VYQKYTADQETLFVAQPLKVSTGLSDQSHVRSVLQLGINGGQCVA
jgi:hypothetical protein